MKRSRFDGPADQKLHPDHDDERKTEAAETYKYELMSAKNRESLVDHDNDGGGDGDGVDVEEHGELEVRPGVLQLHEVDGLVVQQLVGLPQLLGLRREGVLVHRLFELLEQSARLLRLLVQHDQVQEVLGHAPEILAEELAHDRVVVAAQDC